MKRYLVDTNVLLRFLLDDNESLSPRAREFFGRAEQGEWEIVLTDVGIAEATWVLQSHYKADRVEIASSLTALLNHASVVCQNRQAMLDALRRYASANLDFIDCYLAAMAAASGAGVASFDRDLRRFGDIKVWDG